MSRFIKISVIIIWCIILTGCGGKDSTSTPSITVMVNNPTQPAYPYPSENTVPTVKSEYPAPVTGTGVVETPSYQVTNLVIPTPSPENGVVTGQLLVGGEGGVPYISTLYLAETVPPSTPGYPPLIAFSEKSDQLGIQDVETGRFLFTNVPPGEYAIIVWNPFGGNPLTDEKGDSIIFTVNAGEVKDLGVIPIE
jgi:hypothetical protein